MSSTKKISNKEKVLDTLQDKVYAIWSNQWNNWYVVPIHNHNYAVLVFKLSQRKIVERFIEIRSSFGDAPSLEITKVCVRDLFSKGGYKYPHAFFSRDSIKNHDTKKYEELFNLGEDYDNSRSDQEN